MLGNFHFLQPLLLDSLGKRYRNYCCLTVCCEKSSPASGTICVHGEWCHLYLQFWSMYTQFGKESSSWRKIFWGPSPLPPCQSAFQGFQQHLCLTFSSLPNTIGKTCWLHGFANLDSSSSSTNVPENLFVTWSSAFNLSGPIKEVQFTIWICLFKH